MNFGKLRLLSGFVVCVFMGNITYADPNDYILSPLPERWQMEQQYYQPVPNEDNWWKTFNDPVLNQLIDLAVKNNYNVASSIKNIRMAQKAVRQAKSGYFPSISASAGWTKSQEAGALHGGSPYNSSYFTVGASMNWEIDVFGRVNERVKEKKAVYNVSKADYDAVIVSLCANLVTARSVFR